MIAFKRELEMISGELPISNAIPIEKMKSAIIVAVQKNPKLLMADRASMWQSARQCAADGLIPDGREAAFVLFNTRKKDDSGRDIWVDAVQYIPMVYGLRKRALMSGEVKDIREYLVYEGEWSNDRFQMVAGDEERIEHQPIIEGAPGEPERGAIIGGYAIAVLKDGQRIREWLPMSAIEKRRRAAPSQKVFEKGKAPRISDEPLGVWRDWFEEQCKKTLVRAIAKKLPLSSDDMRAIMESDRDFEPSQVLRDQIAKPASLADRLIAAQKPPEPPHDATTGEVLEGTAVAPEYDESVVSPCDEQDEGSDAFDAGAPETSNPYVANPAYSNWLFGWRIAKKVAE